MKINLFNPKCKSCGQDTQKTKIYDAQGIGNLEPIKFRCWGFHCLYCGKIVEELRYRIEIEDPCCEGMRENAKIEDDEGAIPYYDVKSGFIGWVAAVEGTYAFDNMKFCPFCGVELPTKPNSIPV